MGGKREAFLKAIRKNDWVMLARKNFDRTDNYVVIWPYEKNNGYLTQYQMSERKQILLPTVQRTEK